MSEESITRRRREETERKCSIFASLTLAEALIAIGSFSYQKTFLPLQDPISLSIRVLVLIELISKQSITIRGDKIIKANPSYSIIDSIHDEVYTKIKNSKELTVEEWLPSLNGESFSYRNSKLHVKNGRRRIGKILIEKGVFKRPSTTAYRKVSSLMFRSGGGTDLVDSKVKHSILREVSLYLTVPCAYKEIDNLKMEALIVSLSFCGMIEDILLSLPLERGEVAKKRVREIVVKYRNGIGDVEKKEEWSVFSVLKVYLKGGTG